MDAFIEMANKIALAMLAALAKTADKQEQGVFRQATFQRIKNPQNVPSD